MFSKFRRDLVFIKENWHKPNRRPVWQIMLFLPGYGLYKIANWYVNWFEDKL